MLNDLDDLFARLRLATAPAEIEALQNGIWQVWLTSSDAATNEVLEVGTRAMQADDLALAIRQFTTIILLNPSFSEAWNKRATAHYMRGEYRASLADIAETLRREPRHFGALWGRAAILRELGDYRHALDSLITLSGVCPNLPGLREEQSSLQERLGKG